MYWKTQVKKPIFFSQADTEISLNLINKFIEFFKIYESLKAAALASTASFIWWVRESKS